MGYSAELFNWNLKYLKRMGFLDKNKRLHAYLIIAVLTVTIVLAGLNIYINWIGLGEAIFNIYTLLSVNSVIVRAIGFYTSQKNILHLYAVIDTWHDELEQEDEKTSWANLQDYTKKVHRFSGFVFYFMVLVVVIFCSQPILTGSGDLVMEVYIPGVDLHKKPYYEIIYAFQSFVAIPLAACFYLTYMNTFLIFTSFGIFITKDLQTKLENLSNMDDMDAEEGMKKCIHSHCKIIRYRDNLEEIYTLIYLVDVSFYCIIICMMLVYSAMDFKISILFKGVQTLIIQTFLIFLAFFMCDTFSDEGRNIGDAAYNTNWMDRSIEFQKCIILIIARSQRPLQLTAGGLKRLSMEFFLEIVRTAYSFFSFLQGAM